MEQLELDFGSDQRTIPNYWVEWIEPLGTGSEAVYCKATSHDIVASRRRDEPRYKTDKDAIEDFMVVYWAVRKENVE